MSINLIAPSSTNSSILVYDAGLSVNGPVDSVGQLTKVNGVPVNAAIEVQSTTGTILFPRMTTAQKNALPTVVDGMALYDSTLGEWQFRQGGAWGNPGFSGLQSTQFTLSSAQIKSMYTTGIILLAAPGAGNGYIVNSVILDYVFNTADYTGGGAIYLNYGTTGHDTNNASTTAPATLITTHGANAINVLDQMPVELVSTAVLNKALCITNATAVFATGSGTLNVIVTYQTFSLS